MIIIIYVETRVRVSKIRRQSYFWYNNVTWISLLNIRFCSLCVSYNNGVKHSLNDSFLYIHIAHYLYKKGSIKNDTIV